MPGRDGLGDDDEETDVGSGPRTRDERRERIEQIKADQRRAERRRTQLLIAAAVAVALAVIVPTAVVLVNEQRRQAEVSAAAERPIPGVEAFADLGAEHTTEQVEYEQLPPVGGNHHPTWQNCGFYDAPVVPEHAVHSLEHGAVWITYDPELPAADVDVLREMTADESYLLVSPRDDLPAPVVASAWGLQVQLDGVDDERLEPFVLRYVRGEQTPEPGAACHGGVGA